MKIKLSKVVATGGGSSSSESSFHDKREIQIGAVPTADFEMGTIQLI